jgi:acetoin:2,6-dichlorophenolindophenol oxidoreductase subunit beta
MNSVLDSLNQGLHQAFTTDESVVLLGEDVLDPYGGAFKVTRGLSTAFPGRVLTTPISEAGIAGIAAGMALRGLHPVVEIMFGDFITLIADQLVNHIARFRWMYNEQVRVPLVIRTPMGGRRGYGPTHSQTLEKMFLGIPGLRILAPCHLGDPGGLLARAIVEDDDPVLFIENKLLYLLPVQEPARMEEFEASTRQPEVAVEGKSDAPTYTYTLRGAPPARLTLVAYGYMAELARQAALRLAYEYEIFTELVILTQLAPFETVDVLASIRRTGRLLTIEEGSLSLGWGAEIVARSLETTGHGLQAARRVAALDLPIPASGTLEAQVLPDVNRIVQTAQRMV